MKIIKKKSLFSLLLLTSFVFLVSFSFVSAAIQNATNMANLSTKSVREIIESVVNWTAGIAALISALVIVIAGIMWATASGDEDRQGTARKMLISGVVGLLIALAAFAMTRVVTGLL